MLWRTSGLVDTDSLHFGQSLDLREIRLPHPWWCGLAEDMWEWLPRYLHITVQPRDPVESFTFHVLPSYLRSHFTTILPARLNRSTEHFSEASILAPDHACWLRRRADSSIGHDSLCARLNTPLSQSLSEPWGHLIPQSFSFLPSLASTQNARSSGPLPSHILILTLRFVPLPWVIFPFPLSCPVKLLPRTHIAPCACPDFPYSFHRVNAHSFKTHLNHYSLLGRGESPPASSELPCPTELTSPSMFAS